MASVERRVLPSGKVSWRAHYRTPDGRPRNKSFALKRDAERYLATIENAKLTGGYIDPGASKLTVGAWGALWLDAQGHLKPSTRERYAGILRTHVLPRWSEVRLGAVNHAAVQGWVGKLGADVSPSAAVKAHRVLSLVLALAVRDGRLARNPADGVSLPREVQRDRDYLTHAQVGELATAAGVDGLVVEFLAYTGLRFGEMAALRVRRLDLLRRRVEVAESVTAINGVLMWGTPKGHLRRRVGVPRFLIDQLVEHVAGKAADDLVFTSRHGTPLRASNFRRDVFTPAAAAAGLNGLTPHALRHTAASLAIAAGADVKVVQQMLGHKSATMTLDLYGHLFADRLDEVTDALDAARAAVANPLPRTAVVDLKARRQGAAGQ